MKIFIATLLSLTFSLYSLAEEQTVMLEIPSMNCAMCPITVKMTNMSNKINPQSELTCPKCGYKKLETMPTDACQWFYECESCTALMKPLPGDCCVYCSYGSIPCPPIQQNKGCCNS